MAGIDGDMEYKCNIEQVQPQVGLAITSSQFLEYLEFLKWVKQKFKAQAKILAEIKDDLAEIHHDMKGVQVLSLGWSAKELGICARLIWRQIMQKRRVPITDGKQLIDPNAKDLVMRAAEAMGMVNQILEMKEMSRICIIAGDGMAHYSTLESLEHSVGICLSAMEIFPSLRQSHPHECSTISQFQRFKELLPESFRD